MRPILTDGVAWSVGRSVTLVSPAKTAAPIELPFGLRTWVGPGNHVLDGAQSPPWEGENFWGRMLDAIKHITDDKFFFQEDSALVHCVCNTIQLSEISDFRASAFCQVVQKHLLFEVAWYSVFWLPTLSVTFLPKYIKIHSCASKLQQAKGETFFETWCTK